MNYFQNKTVLITGAASGIGFLMASILIEDKISRLIVLDKNTNLKAKFDAFKESTTDISLHHVDITDEFAVATIIKELSTNGISVDILINNAGVVTGKNFEEHSLQEIELNMQVNSIAPMKLTSMLLPDMLEKGVGDIVNISSAASMIANPKMSVYCASKWAMTGWSQSLLLEMKRNRKDINVLTVMPYYIDTGMFEGVRSPIVPILNEEKTANRILKAVAKRKANLRMPWIVSLLPLIKGILPKVLFDWIVGKIFGIYNSMDQFKGREND